MFGFFKRWRDRASNVTTMQDDELVDLLAKSFSAGYQKCEDVYRQRLFVLETHDTYHADGNVQHGERVVHWSLEEAEEKLGSDGVRRLIRGERVDVDRWTSYIDMYATAVNVRDTEWWRAYPGDSEKGMAPVTPETIRILTGLEPHEQGHLKSIADVLAAAEKNRSE